MTPGEFSTFPRNAVFPPATDAKAALEGSMMPFGGYKGVRGRLPCRIAGGWGQLSIEAPPVRIGQTYIVIDPTGIAGQGWLARVGRIAEAVERQEGARLPGSRRRAARKAAMAEGLFVPSALVDTLKTLASRA